MSGGKRVVVGMSGGVDSSVCAALLAEAGHEVVGVTLQLYDHGKAVGRKGACCAGQDIHDARQVADRLGIAHYVLDYEARFKSAVIDEFAGSYARGETPIPCVLCNQTVKFTDLLETARDLGAEALATGHYARRVMGAGGPELHRAMDAERDQSYFLFATTRDQLDFLRFPLGDRTKAEIREIARRFDLPVAEKPDSQDICFVPNGSYSSVVEAILPETRRPGDIVMADGTVLGRHDGIVNFTVGQRRGLRVGGRLEPLFVLRLEADTARVVVGPRAELAVGRVRLHGVNWLGSSELPEVGSEVEVKLRSAQPPVSAEILAAGADGVEIRLATPAFGVAPGQAGVLYQGSRLVGGGWIRAEVTAEQAA